MSGMPWGGLREQLTGERLVKNGGCPFPKPRYDTETRAWLDLLVNGTFSAETLALTPVTFEIDPLWVERLFHSMSEHGETWLHHLFIGTYQLEVGNPTAATASFEASLRLLPSVHGYRNLAIFADTVDAASALYQKAWDVWTSLDTKRDPSVEDLGKDLASEFAAWLMLNSRWLELKDFLAGIDRESFLGKDRVLHARAALVIQSGDHKSALSILTGNCFPTYGGERQALIDLWWAAKRVEAVEMNGGKQLSKLQLVHLRRQLGCDGDSTDTTISSNCTRGPPNLGLRYGGF